MPKYLVCYSYTIECGFPSNNKLTITFILQILSSLVE